MSEIPICQMQHVQLSLKIKIDGPEVLGKIDLSKVDSSVRPKCLPNRKLNKYIQLRDRLDSGWGWTFKQLVSNFKNPKQ
jgi:hypothetical protein